MLCPGVSVFDRGIVEDPKMLRPRVIAREMSAAPPPGHPFQIVCHLSEALLKDSYLPEFLLNIIFRKQLTTDERLR
jgi:hypothetical protein